VCFYGYLRGTFLKEDSYIHIPGCGDFKISKISSLEDPLPVIKKKNLSKKLRSVYAPMSNLGDLFYDNDSVYLNVFQSKNENGDEKDMLQNMKNENFEIDKKIKNQQLFLLKKNVNPIRNNDIVQKKPIEIVRREIIVFFFFNKFRIIL
jgi:ribosome biogenesis protein BMS1